MPQLEIAGTAPALEAAAETEAGFWASLTKDSAEGITMFLQTNIVPYIVKVP